MQQMKVSPMQVTTTFFDICASQNLKSLVANFLPDNLIAFGEGPNSHIKFKTHQ